MDGALILPNQILIAADLLSDDLANAMPLMGLVIGLYTIIAGGATLFFGYCTDIFERKKLIEKEVSLAPKY